VVGGADVGRMKDEHGEVCPANRREGARTIRDVPISKLGCFAAVDGQHENGMANGMKRARASTTVAKAKMSVRIGSRMGWPHDVQTTKAQ